MRSPFSQGILCLSQKVDFPFRWRVKMALVAVAETGYGEPAWVPPPEVFWPGGFISRKVMESRRVDAYRFLALGRALTHARVDVAESGIISPGLRRPLRQTRSASRCNRSQVFAGFNLPGGLSTSSVNLDSQEDVANLILTLRKERSRLLQEIEAEEEERAWFYSQLENINQQLRRLATTDNVSVCKALARGSLFSSRVTRPYERLGSRGKSD
ncbi:hypothetical protein C7M84_003742 [Penaeus vannamei]|uniref:Uncharacterized protein n=1 Tax=Penaeus vannamei TaxID=6689 RepID=A0A3R7QTG5_PENVA|nr:hypothetical protein C7M84_003742 [Penaeus vannamei]